MNLDRIEYERRLEETKRQIDAIDTLDDEKRRKQSELLKMTLDFQRNQIEYAKFANSGIEKLFDAMKQLTILNVASIGFYAAMLEKVLVPRPANHYIYGTFGCFVISCICSIWALISIATLWGKTPGKDEYAWWSSFAACFYCFGLLMVIVSVIWR